MDMFPHVVTVYNTETTELPENNFEPSLVNHITVLRGVLLDASKGSNVAKSGLEGADAVILYIPVSVEAVDGVTGAQVSHETGIAVVTLSKPVEDAVLAKAITDRDYKVLSIQ